MYTDYTMHIPRIDARHAYLGYIVLRDLWITDMRVQTHKNKKLLLACLRDDEIQILYYMVATYLKTINTRDEDFNEGLPINATRFTNQYIVPSQNSTVLIPESDIRISVKELNDGDCISGFMTVRIYRPAAIGLEFNDYTISGIHISESYGDYIKQSSA